MKIIYRFAICVYVASILLFDNNVFAQNESENFSSKIDSLLNQPFLKSCITAVSAYDLNKEKFIYNKNEKLLLRPASTIKILTSSAALLFLGEDYEFQTKFYYTGDIIDSVITGDLFVAGGCDPDFTVADLDSVIDEIKESGIKTVAGNLYGDISMMDSLWWGKGWMWDDDPYSYCPHLTPLIINDAGVEIIYSPGDLGKTVDINISPETEYYTFVNKSITVDDDSSTLEISRDWINRNNNFYAIGNYPYNKKTDTLQLNVFRPEMFFLTIMKEHLMDAGINFSGRIDTGSVPEYAEELFSISRSLTDVINNMNKESDNLSAEMILRALAFEFYGGPASAENGVKLIDSLIILADCNPDDYSIVDGSGLSHYNLISADLLISVLKYIYYINSDIYEIIINSFPIAGIDGTLEERMTAGPAYNNVHAKTGTLTGVSCLAGYLNSGNGHKIAFSIFIENFVFKAKTARLIQDEICQILCSIN